MAQTLGTVKEGDVIESGPQATSAVLLSSWAGFTLVSVYTREDALADGTLVDVSEHAKGFFKFPVAMTEAVWSWTIQARRDENERDWQALVPQREQEQVAAHSSFRGSDRFKYRASIGRSKTWILVVCGPGDEGEPVITIMEPG